MAQGGSTTRYNDGECLVEISRETEDPSWDAFVRATPGGHVAQSSSWAHLKSEVGYSTGRVTVSRSGEIVGGIQFLLRHVRLIGSVAYASRAPLFMDSDPALFGSLLRGIHRLCRSSLVRYAIVQPPRGGDQFSDFLLRSGFHVSPVPVGPTATFLLDVSRSEEEIFRSMRRRTREHIRRAVREGVAVREGTRSDLPLFHRLHSASGERRNHQTLSESYYERMWDILRPHGFIHLFFAEVGAVPISTILVIAFGETATCYRLGWSGTQSNLGVNDLLHWQVFRWAKKTGFHYVDLEGVNRGLVRMLIQGTPLSENDRRRPSFIELGYRPAPVLLPEPYGFMYSPLLRPFHRQIADGVRNSSVAQRILGRVRDH